MAYISSRFMNLCHCFCLQTRSSFLSWVFPSPPAFSFCPCLLSASSEDIKYSGHSDPSPSCRSVWALNGELCCRKKHGAQPQTGCAVLGAVLCLGGSFLARVAGSFTLPAFITDP